MSIHNKPLEIEEQVLLMKKYVVFSRKVRMKKFLMYAGYFRASRYGKYLLSNTTILGKKPEQDLLFAIYDFDMKLREVLMKYCKKAEIQFKSHLSNSISIKTDTATFYLNDDYYTPSKSERDKKKKESNIKFFEKFKRKIVNNEGKLRSDILKYPELKEYRKGGKKSKYKIPSWVAFSYFEFGTITLIYSYLKGDLRKEVLKYGYSKNRYGKEVTKQVDTWLDAIRNLRNVCAHHNVLVGRTSSIVLFNNEDYDLTLSLSNTNLFSRLYALKKVLNNDDARLLKEDLEKIIKRSKIDIYELNILPVNWEDIYDGIKLL
ncbi:Abi family protein [Romboutsia sedimentorum]|uniref:Abi family protein n=1 Tax=Romboutsia sedimentorum TaxID=1368474 RepID=UPI0024DF01C3|nr:Abi family protein [Romboutsia sedimentorum]MDK2584587.1 Abi family protein [Romboutsia sedimentorum]